MIWLKSVAIGLLLCLVTAVVSIFVVPISLSFAYRPAPGEAIGWDPIQASKSPVVWIVAALVFFAGFAVEYRRLSH